MNNKKIGDLFETVVPKYDRVWGDRIGLYSGKHYLGVGRIIKILAVGGALMKVVVEIMKWVGK